MLERPRPAEAGAGWILPMLRRFAPVAAAVALLLAMLAMSRDFGATWDERALQKYGEEVWEYFAGRRALDQIQTVTFANGRIYGAFVEVLNVAVQHLVPANVYVVRHAVNAAFGWAGIVFVFLLASKLFGRGAGWIAAALLVSMPRYVAESMNNAKDLPFAVLMLVGLYYILTLQPRYPYFSWSHALRLVAATALALNVRAMGLVLLGYAGLALLIAVVASGERSPRLLGATLARYALVCIAAIVAGTAFWPWAQQRPLTRPFEAFFTASGVSWGLGGIYMGRDLPSELPWHYVPVWLGITLPLVVLAGIGLSLVLSWRRAESRLYLAAIWGVVLLPVTYVTARHLTLYDGIRHIYFVVPPLAILAGVAWSDALAAARNTRLQLAVAVLLAAGIAEPLVFQLRNHPNQTVYFNAIVGGPRGAFGRFEMDYWGNCMQEGVAWSAAQATAARMPLGVSGHPWEIVAADATRYPSVYFTLPYRSGYHLSIQLLRGTRQGILEAIQQPDILHRVTTADGTPLCLVTRGPQYSELSERRGPR